MGRSTIRMADSSQIWALSDGRAGNARQAMALAASLAQDPSSAAVEMVLEPRAPWRWWAPRRLPGSNAAFGGDFARMLSAPPALAVGCGRQAALATRLLRARGTRVVQVLDPRLKPVHWDLVVAPAHDGLSGRNVLTLAGSLNPVDDAWLARARRDFAQFAALPSPRTAVLLGGPSAHAGLDAAAFDTLASRLDAVLARDGGSVLLTASRRTPDAVREAARRRYARTPGVVWCGPDDGSNPYPGLLAWSERIVCTADSVNMISEACATALPVFVFAPGEVSGRPRLFLDTLVARGRVRAMDDALAPFPVQPLRETARVAAEVRRRFGL